MKKTYDCLLTHYTVHSGKQLGVYLEHTAYVSGPLVTQTPYKTFILRVLSDVKKAILRF